ncbi:MAG: amidohydrolase family protein [Burkholderiales bacterium]|nr:amidohydrolase family protein [Burkholderiales bacterium]
MTIAKPRDCDVLLTNACVLTMDVNHTIVSPGAVAVVGHTIVAVGPQAEIAQQFRARSTIDARGGIVHPGYVDAHLHVNAQTCRGFFRGDASKGAGSGPKYADWKAALTPEDERAAAALACVEMLRHGVTTFMEPGSAFEPDAVAAATTAVGVRCSLADPYLWDETELMRAIPGLASDSLFARVPPERDRCLKALGGQLFRNRDKDGILHGHVALYGEGTASDELLRAAKALADRSGVVLNSHIGYDIDLALAMERHWQKSRFVYLADLGILGPNTTFVHMNLIREDEVQPILSTGTSMVWCPLAYMSRGTPLRQRTRLPEMKQRGGNVALGTDSARQCSAGDSGFLALHLAAEAGYSTVSEDVLDMLTLGGARAVGLADLLGSIEAGKRADIVVRRPDVAEMGPGVDPAHQLVSVGHGATADTVLVNGRIVLEAGEPTQADFDVILTDARTSVQRMLRRLDMPQPGLWPRVA